MLSIRSLLMKLEDFCSLDFIICLIKKKNRYENKVLIIVYKGLYIVGY